MPAFAYNFGLPVEEDVLDDLSRKHVDKIHRLLTAPLEEDSDQGISTSLKKLGDDLHKCKAPALEFVGRDLNCIPPIAAGQHAKKAKWE